MTEDHELEKIRLKKAEMMLKLQTIPKKIINIQSLDEFNRILNDYTNEITIVDFWAIWCGPCKAFAPTFERIQQEHSKEFIFLKVNVDDHSKIATQYGISGIPTTLFFKNKKVIHKVVGTMNYNNLKLILQKLKDLNN